MLKYNLYCLLFKGLVKIKILVTGGTGYIGSHTAVQLLEAGHEVVIIDNLANSKAAVTNHIAKITGKEPLLYVADVLDAAALNQIFEKEKPDAVMHFAALKAVGESMENPLMYFETNVSGTINVLNAMKAHGVNLFVFSSSATVYGDPITVPLTEEHPLNPVNVYGHTKKMVEDIMQSFAAANKDFAGVSLRYFNPIGAHPSGLLGEDPNGIPNNLMPYIINVATGKSDYLRVFGNDYETVDGTGVRDYIHVEDLAAGHINSLEYIASKKGFYAFNLGTGSGTSVLQLVKCFEDATGKKIAYEFCERRAGDLASYYSDPTKANALLGWKTKYNATDMCLHSYNFIKNKI